MRFKICLRAVLASALLTLPIVSPALAAPAQMHGISHPVSHAIKLKTVKIDTSGPNLSIFSEGQPSPGGHFYIVQFSGPVQESWKQRIGDMGVAFHGYLPDNAFIVKMDASTASSVSADPDVTWVGPYRPEFKIAPKVIHPGGVGAALKALPPAEALPPGQQEYTVKVFDGEDMNPVISSLEAQGATVETVSDRGGLNGKFLRVRMDDSLAQDAAKIDEVEWVEQYIPKRPLNDVAVGIMNVSPVWTESFPGATGLTGTGQVVGIIDTGLDTGDTSTIHPAFAGTVSNGGQKILGHFSYDPSRSGAWSDPDGHGTHTAGSLTGKPFTVGEQTFDARGVAYDAQVVVQSVYEQEDSQNLYIPDPGALSQDFLDAYNDSARIHSDSWGGGNPGEYDDFAQSADTFIWEHKQFVVCFAAGNGGVDANKDGVIDPDSVISPGTAKDVITVGATESYRPATDGDTWGNSFQNANRTPMFPKNPIFSDSICDGANGMAAFSSRGPTSDGRVKPDLAAPGTFILSTKSTVTPLTGSYWATPSEIGPYTTSYDQYFAFDGGTSMATPLTAGSAALVRQYYTDVQNITPSAALIKATLISGAYNMAPGQYGPAGSATQEIYNPPDNSQGWGRVDVGNSISPPAPRSVLFVDYTSGLTTGQTSSYFYNVTDASVPLKVTLVWSDYPGTASAGAQLVNDLDLSVTGPDGTVYHGNQFDASSGYSTPGAAGFDRTNNVEVVNINPSALTTGTVEVDVNGSNVPSGPQQPFAIVVDGGGISTVTCDYSLTSSSADIPSNGGPESFGINCNATCPWTAVSDQPWLTIPTPGGEGTNPAVQYTVLPNLVFTPRYGSISVGGQTFQIKQDEAAVNLSMLPVAQNGRAVTLNASFTISGTPITNKPVSFYDRVNGGSYVNKGTAKTNSLGVATLKFTAALGQHSAYAKTLATTLPVTGTIPGMQAATLGYAIDSVTLLSPGNGQPVATLPVVLYWNTTLLPDATDYQVQVCSNPYFSPPAALQNYSISAGSYALPDSYSPGAVGFWRVRAVLPTGNSLYSQAWKFIYKPIPVLGLSVAQISATKVTLTATVEDGSGAGIGGRKVYFYADSVLKGYSLTNAGGTAVKTIPGTSGPHTYQVQFRGDAKYSPAAPAYATLP